jgi:hypothetical protein
MQASACYSGLLDSAIADDEAITLLRGWPDFDEAVAIQVFDFKPAASSPMSSPRMVSPAGSSRAANT